MEAMALVPVTLVPPEQEGSGGITQFFADNILQRRKFATARITTVLAL